MNSEILAGFDYLEREKGIKRELLIKAIESALVTAARKAVGPARDLRVEIDPKTAEIRAFATLQVVEKVLNKHDEIALAAAQKIKPGVQIGDTVEVKVPTQEFGRIAAQTAKQAMMQHLRQAEKAMVYDEFKDRAGEIVSGTIRRFERSDVIIDLGRFEAIMPSKERVQTEDYAIGDRIRAYVLAVENGHRGPEIILSRSHPNFVRRLFEVEVAEIADHTVEIRGIAREAGHRTKLAVYSADSKVDPVGACVGMKGARVKNIVRELNNEKVDIIRWSEDPKEFALEALKPAKVKSVTLDPNRKNVLIKVDEDQLSLAIGKRGQNARLTSRLLGWDISIEKDESQKEAFESSKEKSALELAASINIDSDTAHKLIEAGLINAEVIYELNAEELAEASGLTVETAQKILNSARPTQSSDATAS